LLKPANEIRISKLKYHQALQYYPSVLNILCVTYFMTSVTMLDPQTREMDHTEYDVSALSGISAP